MELAHAQAPFWSPQILLWFFWCPQKSLGPTSMLAVAVLVNFYNRVCHHQQSIQHQALHPFLVSSTWERHCADKHPWKTNHTLRIGENNIITWVYSSEGHPSSVSSLEAFPQLGECLQGHCETKTWQDIYCLQLTVWPVNNNMFWLCYTW